jgi:hypothetical protein
MSTRPLWTAVAIQFTAVAPLHAQPWVPPRGEGSVTLTYQNYYTLGHYDVQGHPNTNGATHAKSLIVEVDVAITDSFALTVSLPYVATKYTGPDEYRVGGIVTHPGPLDDRTYHGALQDLHIEGRRVCWAGSVAIAPLVSVIIPTHDYQTHGEAVPGRHRRELQLGVTAGTDLNRVLPKTYAHGRYALNTAERSHGFASVTSSLNVEGGVDATSMLTVRGLAAWQFRHRGPTIPELAADDWLGHDRFIVSSYFTLGGGMSILLTPRTEIDVLWVATISGKSGAHRSRMLAVGSSWSFGKGMGGFPGFAALKDRQSRSSRRARGF